ncbi:MAG: hypothetical protein F6K55_03125 [Moorea sp. SIO4A3]|nr:hypothetical protein [Moorena sp. SIO4A3]
MTTFNHSLYLSNAKQSFVEPFSMQFIPKFSNYGVDLCVYTAPGVQSESEPKEIFFDLDSVTAIICQESDKESLAQTYGLVEFEIEEYCDQVILIPAKIANEYWLSHSRIGNQYAKNMARIMLSLPIEEDAAIALSENLDMICSNI